MFPVPAHLPRTAAPGALAPGEGAEKADAVLDLLGPLFAGGQELSVEGVRGVQTKLQEAITDNKVRLQPRLEANLVHWFYHWKSAADPAEPSPTVQLTGSNEPTSSFWTTSPTYPHISASARIWAQTSPQCNGHSRR